MLRAVLSRALPVASTVVAVLYTKERKGWAWAAAAGLGAHAATEWLTSLVINGLEANQTLPPKPVDVRDEQVVIPEIKEKLEVPGPSSNALDGGETVGKLSVIDKHNNVIRLPNAMGEP